MMGVVLLLSHIFRHLLSFFAWFSLAACVYVCECELRNDSHQTSSQCTVCCDVFQTLSVLENLFYVQCGIGLLFSATLWVLNTHCVSDRRNNIIESNCVTHKTKERRKRDEENEKKNPIKSLRFRAFRNQSASIKPNTKKTSEEWPFNDRQKTHTHTMSM